MWPDWPSLGCSPHRWGVYIGECLFCLTDFLICSAGCRVQVDCVRQRFKVIIRNADYVNAIGVFGLALSLRPAVIGTPFLWVEGPRCEVNVTCYLTWTGYFASCVYYMMVRSRSGQSMALCMFSIKDWLRSGICFPCKHVEYYCLWGCSYSLFVKYLSSDLTLMVRVCKLDSYGCQDIFFLFLLCSFLQSKTCLIGSHMVVWGSS